MLGLPSPPNMPSPYEGYTGRLASESAQDGLTGSLRDEKKKKKLKEDKKVRAPAWQCWGQHGSESLSSSRLGCGEHGRALAQLRKTMKCHPCSAWCWLSEERLSLPGCPDSFGSPATWLKGEAVGYGTRPGLRRPGVYSWLCCRFPVCDSSSPHLENRPTSCARGEDMVLSGCPDTDGGWLDGAAAGLEGLSIPHSTCRATQAFFDCISSKSSSSDGMAAGIQTQGWGQRGTGTARAAVARQIRASLGDVHTCCSHALFVA